jgi:hypothetical protein
MSDYRVQRCRSHEVGNVPRAWETVYETDDTADAIREFWGRRRVGLPCGDQYRIVDANGVEQVVISADECVPDPDDD